MLVEFHRYPLSSTKMTSLDFEVALKQYCFPSLQHSRQFQDQQKQRRQRQRRRQARSGVMSWRSLWVLGLGALLGLAVVLPSVRAVEEEEEDNVTVGPLVGETDATTRYEAKALLTNDDKELTNDDFSGGPRRVPIAPFELMLLSWDDLVGSNRRTALELLDVVEQVLEEYIAARLDEDISKSHSNTTLQFVRIGKLVSFKSDPVVGAFPGGRRSLQADQGFYYETKIEVDQSTASFSVLSPGDIVPSMDTLAIMVEAALGRTDSQPDVEEEGGRSSVGSGSALLRALSLEDDFKSVAGYEYESHSFAPTLAPVIRPTGAPTSEPTTPPTVAPVAVVVKVPDDTVRDKEIVPLKEDAGGDGGGGGDDPGIGILVAVTLCALLCCAFGAASFFILGRRGRSASQDESGQEQARSRDMEQGEVVKPKAVRRQLLEGDASRKNKWPPSNSVDNEASRKRTESSSSLTTTSKEVDEEEMGLGTPETTTSSPSTSNRKRPRIVPVIPISEFLDSAEQVDEEATTPPRMQGSYTPATSAASSPSTIQAVAPSPSPPPEEVVMSHVESFQDRRDAMNVVLHKDMLTTHSAFAPPPPLPPPSPQNASSPRKKPSSARTSSGKSNSSEEKPSGSKTSRRSSSRRPRRKSGTNKKAEEKEDEEQNPDNFDILEPSHLTAATIAKYPCYNSASHVSSPTANLLLPHQEKRTMMRHMDADAVDDAEVAMARRYRGVSDFQNLEFEPDAHWDPDDNDVTDENTNMDTMFRPATEGGLRNDDGSSSNPTSTPAAPARKKRTARSMSPALIRTNDSIPSNPTSRRPSLPTNQQRTADDAPYWADGARLFPYLMDLVVPSCSGEDDEPYYHELHSNNVSVVQSLSTEYSTDDEEGAGVAEA